MSVQWNKAITEKEKVPRKYLCDIQTNLQKRSTKKSTFVTNNNELHLSSRVKRLGPKCVRGSIDCVV